MLTAIVVLSFIAVLTVSACSQGVSSSQESHADAPEAIQVAGDDSTVRFALPESWERLHFTGDALVYYDGASASRTMVAIATETGSAADGAESWADAMTSSGVEVSSERVEVDGEDAFVVQCTLDGAEVAVYFVPVDDERYAKVAFQADASAIDEVRQLMYASVSESGAGAQWAGDDQVGYVKLPLDFVAMGRSADGNALDFYIPEKSSSVGAGVLAAATVVELPGIDGGPVSDEFFASVSGEPLRNEQLEVSGDAGELWAMVVEAPVDGMLDADYEYLFGDDASMVDVRYAPKEEGMAAYAEYDEVAKSYIAKKPTTGVQDFDALTGAAKNLLAYMNMTATNADPVNRL